MSLTELGLLFAVLAHSVAVIAAAIKLIAWIVKKQAVTDERIRQLQHQVDNDVTGSRVVGEMRNDKSLSGTVRERARVSFCYHESNRICRFGRVY